MHFFDILNRLSKIEQAGSPLPSRVPRPRILRVRGGWAVTELCTVHKWPLGRY